MPGSRTLTSLALLVVAGLFPVGAEAAAIKPPTSLVATLAGSSAIDLVWNDPNERESGYKVERGTSPTSFQAVVTLAANATSYRDGGLASGTRYYYRVAPVASGKTQYSPVASATTADGAPPAVPAGVTATPVACTQVNLSWSASADTGGSGLKGYNVYRNGAFWRLVLAPALSTADTGVASGTAYGYAVSAVDNAGNESARSATVNVTTPACADAIPPSTPTGLSATATSCSQTSISWNASTDGGGSGLRGYNIYRNGAFLRLVLAPATSTTDIGLAGGTGYTYTAVAVDNAGNLSATSAGDSATTPACGDATPPTTPTGVTAAASACTTASLSWNASTDSGGSGLKGYNLYRNGVFVKQVAAPATSTTDTGLAASTAYGYRVGAVDNAGNVSALSAVASTTTPTCADTTPPTAPTGATATALSCGSIAVSWNASTDPGGSGVKGYNVYRNGGFWTQVSAPATSVTDTGRSALTSYSYIVLAVDNANNGSGLSNLASATTPSCGGTTSSTTPSTSTSSTTTTPTTSSSTTTVPADATAPSVPSGVTASPVACNQVNVAWNASSDGGGSGLASYLVYRNNALLRQVFAPATSTADTTVGPAASYSYQVAAVDVAGNASARSAGAVTSTPGCPLAADPELIGFVPQVGAAKAVTVVPTSGLAYVASMEFGLAVVDVSDAAHPRATGGAVPSFYGERVAVSGSLAVLTGNTLGLYVVDVGDRTDPRVVGTLAGTMKGVALSGSYAYAIQIVPGNPARTDLVVVDLRAPTAPAIVGRVTLAGGSEVELSGSHVFVAAGLAGLQVVDVSSPTAPRIVATRDTPGDAKAVSVSGNWAYVADGTSIQVVDVTTRSNPVIRAWLPNAATAVAASGLRLYALGGGLLQVIDVASPLAPLLRNSSSARGAQGLAASGNLVYLASPETNAATQAGGLYVVDATVPTLPVVRSNLYGGFDTWGVAVAGSTAVATGNALGLRVVDVAAPGSPRVLGALAGTMKGVARAGSYAYAINVVPGNPARTDVVAVSLSTPAAPAVAGRVTVGGGSEIDLLGSYVYVAAATAGLQVVDVSAPTSLRIVGTRDTPGSAADVAVSNGWAWVADTTSIQVVDVSAPSNPVVRGSLATAATRVAVAYSRLYALAGGQLVTIDASSPTAPRVLSTVSGRGAQALDARGSSLFLATPALNHFDAAGGVYVLDAAGTTPQLVEQVIVPGMTRALVAPIGTDLVYAGDSASVLDVVDTVP
jgi:fibronectin type 3 domain-containing protein